MKVLLVFAVSAIVLGTFAFARMDPRGLSFAQTRTEQKKDESPFVCDTLALTPEIRKRHFQVLGPTLVSLRTGVRELPTGYEFTFPNEQKTYEILTEWVFQESQCCPFFDLSVRLEREHGALVLSATGREGTKAFIQTDAARWVAPVKSETR